MWKPSVIIGNPINTCAVKILLHHRLHPAVNKHFFCHHFLSLSLCVQGRSYFVQDYTSAALHPQSLWQSPVFRDLITLHPVKQPENLYAVHHYYEVARARKLQKELQDIESGVNYICEKIPEGLSPPWQIMPSCSVQLCSGGWTKVGVATYSTPFTVATKLPKLHNPPSIYELAPWDHFSTSTSHSVAGFTPEHGLYSSFQSEIAGVVGLIEHHVNSAPGTTELRPVEVIQGYTRFSEDIGREYILDLMFVEADDETSVLNKRFRLIRPLSPDITMVTEPNPSSETTVNIILPVSQADKTFTGFMEWYFRTTLHRVETNVHLILCVVGDTQTLFTVQTMVANLTKLQPSSRTTILSGTPNLSPTGALELGVSVLTSTDLVFLADTRVRIRPFFFNSCRFNTLPASRVYFPVPYVMFEEPEGYPGPGRWGFYSVSSVCIYKSDFLKFSDSPKSLFQRVSASQLELFQAPDPGLIRVSRAVKDCRNSTSDDAEWEEYCGDYTRVTQFESGTVDYLYEHDQAAHKSLSFAELSL